MIRRPDDGAAPDGPGPMGPEERPAPQPLQELLPKLVLGRQKLGVADFVRQAEHRVHPQGPAHPVGDVLIFGGVGRQGRHGAHHVGVFPRDPENTVGAGDQQLRDVHAAVPDEGAVKRRVHAGEAHHVLGPDGVRVFQGGVVVEHRAGLGEKRVPGQIVRHEGWVGEEGRRLAQHDDVRGKIQGLGQGQGPAADHPAVFEPLAFGPGAGVGRFGGRVLGAGVHHVGDGGAVQEIHEGLAVGRPPDFHLDRGTVEERQGEHDPRVLQDRPQEGGHRPAVQGEVVPGVPALVPHAVVKKGNADHVHGLFGLGDHALPQKGADAADGGRHGGGLGGFQAELVFDGLEEFRGQSQFHGHFQNAGASAGGRHGPMISLPRRTCQKTNRVS